MTRSLLISTGIVLTLLVVWLMQSNSNVSQPIAFNHRLHTDEVGADCVDCHQYARSGTIATIPNIAVCVDCHEEAQTESAEELRVIEFIQHGDLIPWRKIYRVPDHVYFSHRRHTQLAEIACETCHGSVGSRTDPVTKPLVQQSMDWCIDCHERSGVTKDCVSCHV
jgi:menaquinone reductase, multiheme cytochrome c subunit